MSNKYNKNLIDLQLSVGENLDECDTGVNELHFPEHFILALASCYYI